MEEKLDKRTLISVAQAVQICGSERELTKINKQYTRRTDHALRHGTLALLANRSQIGWEDLPRNRQYYLIGSKKQVEEILERLAQGDRNLLLYQQIGRPDEPPLTDKERRRRHLQIAAKAASAKFA